MEITEFFAQTSSVLAENNSVVLFTGKSYSPLFFDRLLIFIQKNVDQPLKKINLESDLSEIQISLHTTFLGQTQLYWFGDLSLISSKKKRSDWVKFISTYRGPHRIVGFVEQEEIEASGLSKTTSLVLISIQESYKSDQIRKISILYNAVKPEVAVLFFTKLYRINKEYSLDQICLLQDYAGLLGKNMDSFFDSWVEKLVVSDISLFYLSQLFFEKKAEEFFVKWSAVRPYYSDQFWTTFFSEQLFKSYFYVQWGGRVPADQRQISFGLPFSFLKQDFKLYTTFELQAAHQKMYEIDLALKSGGSQYRLDAFFALFFAGDFS
ncbi:MAG: hypothetical protein NTU89_03475 [Candidatus Dependentiae bacterium]|nr:hypothetical protein [Candidatus Dependentiae bacterium]